MNSKKNIWIAWAILLVVITFTYRNHFDNDFHFDDGHTIQNNPYITSLENIPLFFTKGPETFSNLPQNQVYRPMVTTTLAIDYWLSTKFDEKGSGFNTVYYHATMFVVFLLLVWLSYLMFIKIFNQTVNNQWNKWLAFFAASWYGLHSVNSETVNYIIARSDLISTMAVVAAFVIYIYYPRLRKFGVFLIPFIIGLLTKQTAAMFGPMLLAYYFIFEFSNDRQKAINSGKLHNFKLKIWGEVIFIFLVIIGSSAFVAMNNGDNFNAGGGSRFLYLITQTYVILHYFISFFVPYNLSADTDMKLMSSMFNFQFFIGTTFIIAMFYAFYLTVKKHETKPIAFGIAWFFFALAPTSSFLPLAEVTNDHRMMFPFVGLMISVVWFLNYVYLQNEKKLSEVKNFKKLVIIAALFILGGHSFSTMARCEVWDNGKSLWYDVTIKSPKNGRGLMNYGLTLMNEGKNKEALDYYNRALEFSPYYSLLYTNIGIAQGKMGNLVEADSNFRKAISLSPMLHMGYYYYGVFLKNQGRTAEAIENMKKASELAPEFVYSNYSLLEMYMNGNMKKDFDELLSACLAKFPTDQTFTYYQTAGMQMTQNLEALERECFAEKNADKILQLTLLNYQAGDYEKSMANCLKGLELFPKHDGLMNNYIASANNLGKYELSLEMGKKALAINPNNQLLKNNLALAEKRLKLKSTPTDKMTEEDLINLSLQYYYDGMFKECIEACNKVISKNPKNHLAYNNICSAYNAMKMWAEAAEAGKKAVKYAPADFEFAKNNLNIALSNLQKK